LYLKLKQKSPVPFDSEISIKYSIHRDTIVFIYLSDILGNRLQNLIEDMHKPGDYEIVFKGHSLPSGVYLFTFATDYAIETGRLIFINDGLNIVTGNSKNTQRSKIAIE
jgi:hypothetical protein